MERIEIEHRGLGRRHTIAAHTLPAYEANGWERVAAPKAATSGRKTSAKPDTES